MVRTVERYEVTLGQLASMPNLHNLLDESEQLHVGDWLVVSACAGFGYADNVVYTHARTHESEYEAVDFAEFSSTLALEHSIYHGGRYPYQYEVWHIVPEVMEPRDDFSYEGLKGYIQCKIAGDTEDVSSRAWYVEITLPYDTTLSPDDLARVTGARMVCMEDSVYGDWVEDAPELVRQIVVYLRYDGPVSFWYVDTLLNAAYDWPRCYGLETVKVANSEHARNFLYAWFSHSLIMNEAARRFFCERRF